MNPSGNRISSIEPVVTIPQPIDAHRHCYGCLKIRRAIAHRIHIVSKVGKLIEGWNETRFYGWNETRFYGWNESWFY
jgi:hypothetical protein